MRTDIVRDYDYTPTAQELLWLEKLARVARAAMMHSEDMVGAVIVYQQASLAAVDVTWGVATHADLRQVAQATLDELDGFVNVEPMRRELRELIEEIDAEPADEIAAGFDPAQAMPEGENSFTDGADPPRKERAG